MHLKELQIFGFKSFPDKVNLSFSKGITIVVGPNGCGKSNIFDGIKWSLGEQSPKSLRGTKMEDIIFNGTEHHPALNYADVSLTFCNEDNYLPIEYKEVEITRRLYRSGESQYFINKNMVRLKDVSDLFMGTGVGESTYSFVEQGKIEAFLSYKPEDKRLIFDEASGIIKYKDRRRETMRRLEETDENLVRLDDIIAEVRRQIRYLERQVEKAHKFREVQDSLVELERKIAYLQFGELKQKTGSIQIELDALQVNDDEKTNELSRIKIRWQELELEAEHLRRQLQEANTQTATLNSQVENSSSHIQVSRQRIDELNHRDAGIEISIKNFNDRLLTQNQRIQEENSRFGVIDQTSAGIENEIILLQEEKNKLIADAAMIKQDITAKKIVIFELESKNVTCGNLLVESQTNLTGLQKRNQRLMLDKARVESLLTIQQEQLAAAQIILTEAESQLVSFKCRCQDLLGLQRKLSGRKEVSRNYLIEADKRLVEYTSYYEFLKDLQTKYDIFPETRKVVLNFDAPPVNINKLVISLKNVQFDQNGTEYKALVEAKVVAMQESELEEKINMTKAEIERIKIEASQVDQEIETVSGQVCEENQRIDEGERRLQEKIQEKDVLERECQRLKEEFDLNSSELNAVANDMFELKAGCKAKEEELAQFQTQLQIIQSQLRADNENTAKNDSRINEIDVELVRRETNKIALSKEKEELNSKITLLFEEKNNIEHGIESLIQEKKENILRLKGFEENISSLKIKIEEDTAAIDACRQTLEVLQAKESELLQIIDQSRNLSTAIERDCEKIHNQIYTKRLDLQGVVYEQEKIVTYMRQVYQFEFNYDSFTPCEGVLSSMIVERDALSKRKISLGEVNLVAIEEFDELKKREEFLEQQKNDLITAKENLKRVIQKINHTCKDLFIETFTKIEEEFKKNYRFLFNGGRADLILIEPDNILESGVEIEVQPPGKKLQNVSLLSGGEKALTAIALIFAIFRVKPSPLCVLDEIDAPLDEANVDRFVQILKEFSSFIQFVVITHNKKTMASADVLYGVTMQERGVSKLVSVKFAENKPITVAQEQEPETVGASAQ